MDKKTFLAIALSIAVLLIYQFFLLPEPPPQGPKQVPQERAEPVQPTIAAPEKKHAVEPGKTTPSEAPVQVDSETARLFALQEEAVARKLKVNNGFFQVAFNTRGASVQSWTLLDYPGSGGEPLEMVPEIPKGDILPLSIMFKDSSLTRSFSEGLHIAEGGDVTLSESHPQETVAFSRVDQSGVMLVKKLTFYEHSYLVDVSVDIRNMSQETKDISWWLFWGPGLGRDAAQKGRFYSGPLTYTGKKASRDRPKKDGEQLMVPPGFKWLGLTDRYFLAAFIPSTKDGDSFIMRHDKTTYSMGAGPSSMFLPAGSSMSLEGKFFLGPKSLDLLKKYDMGLENSLDFGWFGWLGKPLLKILKFFNRYVGNWGVAIILLTLLVKFILFPITFNMYKSMRRMQELQPQMMALKKKFKDDPQTLNRETMALYKTHKVNPMGGCLPMVIQIPVFFALYKVLTIAIELRGAGFLHIQDLSVGETTLGQFIHGHFSFFPEAILPLKIFVIMMGVTMFIQQRLSPTAGDPRQQKMMMFLPVIFTAMFWNFFSGLVVYFLFSNLLAIGEQLLIRKLSSSSVPVAKEKKTIPPKAPFKAKKRKK